jgi:DNA topoisomerase-1
LIIQPVGILVAVFLSNYFSSLFSYDFTKKLESDLDEISNGKDEWYNVCELYHTEIKSLLKPMTKLSKDVFPLNGTDEYHIVYEKYGPVIRKVLTNGSYEYKSINPDIQIDLGRLQKKEYHINDLLDEKINNVIGTHLDKDILLKNGPFGEYIEYDGKTKSIKNAGEMNVTEIIEKYIEVVPLDTSTDNPNILRVINENISIRKGKFGAYIYYKTSHMKQPTFYNIQKFKESYKYCSDEVLIKWIQDTYKIKF